MKKTFVALLVMLAVGVTPVLANDKTNDKATEALKKEFVGAESVKWTDLGDYKMALFIFNEYRIEAYFNNEGELEGFDRYISINQLPLEVLRSFSKHFAKAAVSDILEISNAEGTSYRLNVETQNGQYHVKISSTGAILKTVKGESKPF